MKIYLDYIFFINFLFDFLLLLSVKIILRRNVKLKRIFLGSLIGGLSIFTLFLKINSIELFLIKIIISILMCITSFSFKNIKYLIKNISYLYLVSIVLGGALYFLNIEFSYNHTGLIFYHNGLSINIVVLVIISPIIIYTYIKQSLNLKDNYAYYHNVKIKYNNQILNLVGYLDTGNKLKDPVTKIPIIIIEEKKIQNILHYQIVPYHTISGDDFLKCIKPDEIIIDKSKINKKVLIGLSKKINMEGVECILNTTLININD